MALPRASFPDHAVVDYQAHGLKRTAAAYGSHHMTLRRWLVERGVTIRPQGRRIHKAGER